MSPKALCPTPMCPNELPDKAILCATHWAKVPPELQRSLYRHRTMQTTRHHAYNAGQHRADVDAALTAAMRVTP